MIDSFGRAYYEKFIISPIIKALTLFTPNFFTYLALLIGIMIAPLLSYGYHYTAFVALILSGIFDTLDGSLARYSNRVSPFGAVMDIFNDRVVEFFVILGLYFVDPPSRSIYCLLMLGSILLCITSFLVVGIFIKNESKKSFHYSPGLMERSEAFLLFSFMFLFPNYFVGVSLLFIVSTTLTSLIRLYEFRKAQTQ